MEILLLEGHPDWLGGLLPDLDWITLPLKDQAHDLVALLDPFWLPVCFQAKFKVLMLTYKAITV